VRFASERDIFMSTAFIISKIKIKKGLCDNFAVCVPVCRNLSLLDRVCVWPTYVSVFYAVRVVLKKSRRLVLPRISCYGLFKTAVSV
jgi:hypothetical protein